MKTKAVLQTTTLLACAAAISADAQERPAAVVEPQKCTPAATVSGDAAAAVAPLLRDRGLDLPTEGCPAVEARVDKNGTGLVVTILDDEQTPRRAATPEVAARLIQQEADRVMLAPDLPLTPLMPGLEAPLQEQQTLAGPWLEEVSRADSTTGANVDFWESVALDGVLGGPVQVEGFSVRPGGFVGPEVPYFDIPFAFGIGAVADNELQVSGGGARVRVDVPDGDDRTMFFSLGAGFARIASLVPLNEGTDPLLPNDTLGVVHFGVGFDLGRPPPPRPPSELPSEPASPNPAPRPAPGP